jgi:hypothetical protein
VAPYVRLEKRSAPGSAPTSWLLRTKCSDVVDGEHVIAIVALHSPSRGRLKWESGRPLGAGLATGVDREQLSQATARDGRVSGNAGVSAARTRPLLQLFPCDRLRMPAETFALSLDACRHRAARAASCRMTETSGGPPGPDSTCTRQSRVLRDPTARISLKDWRLLSLGAAGRTAVLPLFAHSSLRSRARGATARPADPEALSAGLREPRRVAHPWPRGEHEHEPRVAQRAHRPALVGFEL